MRSSSNIHSLNRSNQYANQLHTAPSSNGVFGGGGGTQVSPVGGIFPSVCQPKQPYELDDLIHLSGPLTEDAVMRTLQARYHENSYFVSTFFTLFGKLICGVIRNVQKFFDVHILFYILVLKK